MWLVFGRDIEEEKKSKEQKHNQTLERLKENNLSYQSCRRENLQSVRDLYKQEVELRSRREGDTAYRQTKFIQDNINQMQQTLAANNAQLTKLQEAANLEKANKNKKLLEEKREIIANDAKETLEYKDTITMLNMSSEKRLTEEKQLVLKNKEIMIEERKCLIDKSTNNDEIQMAERLTLENEKNIAVQEANQMINDLRIRNSVLDKVYQSATASLIRAHKQDQRKLSDIHNLESVKKLGKSIQIKVINLFNKFDVPFFMKNEAGFKKAAQSAPVNVGMLEKNLNSFETSLGSLQQDLNTEPFVKKTLDHLSRLNFLLSRLKNFVDEKESFTLDSMDGLMQCLNEMLAKIEETITTIENIPRFDKESNFMRESIQLMSTLGEISNETSNIE